MMVENFLYLSWYVLMFKESNEHGISKGLGIFDGSCSQFEKVSIKVPHVGFNFINHDRHKIWKGS